MRPERALQIVKLPVGAPDHCPRCGAPVRVETLTEPQPPRWACLMGHSGFFRWSDSLDADYVVRERL